MQEAVTSAESQRAASGGATPKPFQFFTSLVLEESLGLRAEKLSTLLKLLRTVPTSSVYYHTHHFLLRHHYLIHEPANDFAYWVRAILAEETLGELLASVDTMEYADLEDLRGALADTIERYLKDHPSAKMKFASPGEEFFFVKSIHVIMPTPHKVSTLAEFAQALQRVTVRSIYFHMFEARLRLKRPVNDFSKWLKEQLGLDALAASVARLNPYDHSLEDLRRRILEYINHALAQKVE
jgi:hypothetical protein